MVATLDGSENAAHLSSSQREPQRGAEAIANFYGRFSTDHGSGSGSARPKHADPSLSSYANSIRRSSSGTEFYSQAHSINGGEEALIAEAPSPAKGPRVHTSFSAAAAAASRSSLNKRTSQTSLPSNAAASPSIRNSPSFPSPHVSSSAFGDLSTSSSGSAVSGLVSPLAAAKGTSFDIAAVNQYTPGSLANTFPWLSTNPTGPPAQLNLKEHTSPSMQSNLTSQSTSDSPPVAQYSKGKGFGWNPHEDHKAPRSGSRIRPAPSTSKMDARDNRDPLGRGLGFKSTSELDLPERMRSQRKGALAPPRLSQDPTAISIEEELRPRAGANKHDSAFARLGRAFRRKSKTGSDLKADVGADARVAPPLPKAPRRVPSQALSIKPSDPFAAKALKASSRVVDIASLARGSMDVKGKQRDQDDTDADSQQRMISPSNEIAAEAIDPLANHAGVAHNIQDDHVAERASEIRAPSMEHGRDSEGAARVPGLSALQHPTSDAAPIRRDATAKATERVVAPPEIEIDEDVMVVSRSNNVDAEVSHEEDQGVRQLESETQIPPAEADTIPLTIDSAYIGVRSDAPRHSTNAAHDASKRPTSMESTTSSARRRSLAFLASAISMGSIAAGTEEEGDPSMEKDSKLAEVKGSTTEAHESKSVEDDAAPARPSLTSMPVTVSRTNSNSSVPRSVLAAEQSGPTFTAMSRTSSSDRRRLEPKSATRNDQVPGILSDFLNMDADMSAKDARKAKTKAASQPGSDWQPVARKSRNSSSITLERSISGTSEGRKSSYSTSPKAARPAKGVYMSPPAGPSMGGYVSPFYVAPLTSVDSGLATRHSRTSGRRASASSRSVHSDDSRSVHSGPRRGSASLVIPGRASREADEAADAARHDDARADQSRESATSGKARKVKSSGNLRGSANDQSQEAVPPAVPSKEPLTYPLASDSTAQAKSPSAFVPKVADASVESNVISNASRNSGLATQSNGQRLLRRPKTSGAEAGFATERLKSPTADAEDPASAPRGLRTARASLDDSGRSSKPYSTSPFQTDHDMLDSREHPVTPTKGRGALERPQNSLSTEGVREATPISRASLSEQPDSSGQSRRPSEASTGVVTPSSSRLESQGGAAALFGSPTTRPRTSSLLPSFGFSRSRAGSSAGLEGSGKSPGSFGNASRSASGGVRREPGDPLTSAARSGGADGNDQQLDVSGAARSPRASSSSRPSFHRQLSSSTVLSDAEAQHLSVKPGKKFSLSAFLPYDDEDAAEYAERIATTAPKTQIAAILASSPDAFYVEALHRFMTRFWFNGLPLDIALRKLLMDLHLPKETQQIDRVMEAFAKRYNECNGGLFTSDDQPYILSFSLMMLHTDAFNRNAKNKMTKMDYLRNTGSSGVPTEILEYLYDNLTFTQFIYVEDEEGGRRPSEASGMSIGGTGMSSSLAQGPAANNRTKIDPYYLITQGRLGELRPDLEHLIPEDTPFVYTGTLPTFDVDRLNSAFLHAPSIEIVTTKTPSEQLGSANPNVPTGEEEVVSLKVTKVGVVNRKDDVSDGGKKSASRKWKTSGLLLTGSQLLLFKDVIWINALQSQIIDQVGHSLLCNGIPTDDPVPHEMVEGGVVISPRITYFRPDGVISLADAVAVKDHSYAKYDFVFRLLGAKGRQYLVQAQSENDMNDWIHKINFCASFRTSNIKIRGLDLTPRVGSGPASQDLDSPDPLESRFGRPTPSRLSFSDSDRASRRLDPDDSGRSTPVPEDAGDFSRDTASRNSESEGLPRPSSSASLRMSPATSALLKRATARRELMLTKIAETEVQLERIVARLADEIRLARHFAILTPFLKSTRDRIEMSALPLASRIRALRLEVAKAEARCKILRLDLAAGERVARALLPHAYSSSSGMRAVNRVPSAQTGTPQLSELGGNSDSQEQVDELFALSGSKRNGSNTYNGPSTAPASSMMVKKPATHQRNQMNLNAVSEQPADESPVMPSRRQMQDPPAEDGEMEPTTTLTADEGTRKGTPRRASSPAPSVGSHSSGEMQGRNQRKTRESVDEEVPEEWDMSQVARPGANRISLVDLPSPDELQEVTSRRFHFGRKTPE